MRTGSLLCRRATEGLAPLGAFNQPVHRNYAQIRAALLSELGPRYADYFARPDVEGDGHRIGWIASGIGEPRRWVDLPPDEQQRLEPIKQEIQKGFETYRARLDAAAENSPQNNFGKVLAQASRVPSSEFLYFVGDQPVLAFWGFKAMTARDGIDPLRLTPGGMTLPPGGVPLVPPAVAVPAAVALAERRRPWWLWLLLFLLLLLLLLALWWWWHRPALLGSLVPPVPLVQHESAPAPVAPNPQTVTPARPGQAGAIVPGGGVPGSAVPGAGQGTLPGTDGSMPAGPNGDAGAPGAQDTAQTPPSDTPKPQGQEPTPPGEQGQKDREKQNPPPPQPQQQAEIPKDLPPLPPPGSNPPARPLTLPPTMPPGPAKFMSGTWQSRSGLEINGKPAEELYRFNSQGQGEITLRTRDGSVECHAPAQATVGPNGHLAISEAPSLGCNDGSAVPGAVTDCSGGAQASCVGTNESDGSKFRVDMRSLGAK
jgi:hypothetical protein